MLITLNNRYTKIIENVGFILKKSIKFLFLFLGHMINFKNDA